MKTRWIPAPRGWENFEAHPLAGLTEFGIGIDVDALAEHMQKHGYDSDEAIIMHQGKILDGRHKQTAAIKASITPTFKVFEGKDATAYVAKKLFRQHLTISQRAMMVAALVKDNPAHRPDNPANLPGYNSKNTGGMPNKPPSQSEIAKVVNVSERAVRDAVKVTKNGTPELQEAVIDGTVAVSDAAKVADLPAATQNGAVKDVKKGKARTATGAAKQRKKREPRTKEEVTDAFGTIVPKNRRDAYADPWITEAIDCIAVVSEKFRTARLIDSMHKKHKYYPFFNSKDFIDGCGMVITTLDQLLEHLKERRPAGVCPSCNGEGCSDCSHSGLVYRELHKKLKEKKA